MRILFVALAPPFPPTNGHRMRNYALLRALAEAGHRISLVSFAENGEARAGGRSLGELCREVAFVPRADDGGGGQYRAGG